VSRLVELVSFSTLYTIETSLMQKDKKPSEDNLKQINLLSLAMELGYTIALPLVLFALIGRFADKSFNTSPWIFLCGIISATFISSWLVYRKVKNLIS
jgi:F0F1-type ATP synthase assembly protein I